ncbi:MAG: glycosyltransferase [Bacteroidetes bacterium]|nr:glycosyltransferase [Bacteroidota bacterium]
MAEIVNTKPDISVLIPAYNAESTIASAVWSVLNQSFASFELLVYIDGATDRTVDMVAPIEDDRLRLIVNAQNLGISAARNALLQHAKGKYVAWLDADDIMLPGRLREQFDVLETQQELDFLGGWAELRNSGLKRVQVSTDTQWLETHLQFRNPFIHSSIMARNFFVEEQLMYDTALDYTEDYDLYLRCAKAGKKPGMYPGFVVSYRMPDAEEGSARQEKYRLTEKLGVLLRRQFPFVDTAEAPVIIGFLRGNAKLGQTEFKTVRHFLVQARRQLKKSGKWQRGAAAYMLYQRLRLTRLRFGLWRTLLVMATSNPALMRFMLKQRTKYGR